ncbi:EF hand protein (macronuclear) [Tetrahymena thermophila SB210]|uniref:EF hand protein n=1 Tax=Tetrahymena thermophila (strain SB210) TaxID=312017 RepID=I7MMM9_TETTS|nr:EF hand protein [Tetrahymena thermophila SB210]EAS05998.2 EF hand protein [Tetrahymena thermophila SB210]|eukprot:XP_001026243.2 EF hand protein [Tetrahymena thermophila SB210]
MNQQGEEGRIVLNNRSSGSNGNNNLGNNANNNNEGGNVLPALPNSGLTPKQTAKKTPPMQMTQQALPDIQISCQTTQPNTNSNINGLQLGQNSQFNLSDNRSCRSISSNNTHQVTNGNNNKSQLYGFQQQNINLKVKELQQTNPKKSVYNQEDLRQLLELFNSFDLQQIGLITINYLHQILFKLQKETTQIDDIIMRIAITKEGYVSFDEFLAILTEIEKNSGNGKKSKSYPIQADPKVVEFLRLLDEYRKKCENDGNYSEAKKAHLKILEIKQKEQLRQKNNLRFMQEEELVNIEQLQKNQFEEFTKAWDNYMAEYEATAYLSLEKLKEKHLKEIEEYTNEIRQDLFSKIKYSKQLIEMRHKEKILVKLKQYNDAEKIKQKADSIEDYERKQKEAEIEEKIEMKVSILRKNQSQVLQALLKRIQADRTHQLKQRQQDSNRLIMKNRNIRNELVHKHNNEVKKAVDILKENLHFHENQLENLKKHFRNAQNNPTEKERRQITTEENSLYKPETKTTQQNSKENNHLERNKRSTSLQQNTNNLSNFQIKPTNPSSVTNRQKPRNISVNGRKYRQNNGSNDRINQTFNQ